jgi:hypothetical protein
MSLGLETNDEFFEAGLWDGVSTCPFRFVIETSTVISSSLSNRYIRIMICLHSFQCRLPLPILKQSACSIIQESGVVTWCEILPMNCNWRFGHGDPRTARMNGTMPDVDCTDFVRASSIRFQICGTEVLAYQEPGGCGLLSRYSNISWRV